MMTHIPHPLGVLGLSVFVMAVTAGSQFVEDHDVRLPTVFAVGAVVIGGAWRLSSRFQRFEDHFTDIYRRLDNLDCVRGKKHQSDDCADAGKD